MMKSGAKVVDFHSLLKSQQVVKTLLGVGANYGVIVGRANSGAQNVINFGEVCFEHRAVIAPDVPLGYEDEVDPTHEWSEDIQLSFHGKGTGESFAVLKKWDVFPENRSAHPSMQIHCPDHDAGLPLQIISGTSAELQVTITMDEQFSGQVKRLLLLEVEIMETVNDLVTQRTELTMGAMIFATFLPRGLDRLPASDYQCSDASTRGPAETKLSIEAKPFVPIDVVSLFDIPCMVFDFNTCARPGAFSPPPNYLQAMQHPNLLAGQGSAETLAQDIHYVHHLRANTLEQVISALELCTVGDLLERHSLSAALSHQYCQDILTNHAKLMDLEEIQTMLDIAQYDLHYVSLRAELKDPSSMILRVKMKLRGSNENRPKVNLGTQVFLRPVEEDIFKLPMLGWLPQPFELRGICVHYQLATEEATFEFPAMTMPHDALFLLLRFHVRFDYERYGFLFVQWAISNILLDPYLVETLFPNEDTMTRLRVYFASRRDRSGVARPPPPGLLAIPSSDELGPFLNGTTQSGPPVQTLTPGEADPTTPTTTTGVLERVPDFNAQQTLAIEAIVALAGCNRHTKIFHPFSQVGVEGPLPMPPFVIYGPPGTGKTSTVAEAILRICRQYPSKRVLACAPSEAAADVLCDRLSRHLSQTQLFRLNWWQRTSASLPVRLRPYTYAVDDVFELPSAQLLRQYRVIVCTCGAAGVLKTLSLPLGEGMAFDVVIVDEASQAVEPEVLVPLELCAPGGLMVLSGDTNQLGPITRCPLFPVCSDGASLQERLLRLPFYAHCWPENAKRERKLSLTSTAKQPSHQERLQLELDMDSNRNTSAIDLSGLQKGGRGLRQGRTAAVGTPRDEVPLGVFLFQNYRSHRVILEVPSQQFYASALEERADRRQTEFLAAWERMPRTPRGDAFPLMIIGVDGKHEHEVGSPSFFNYDEIMKVVEVCRDLVHSRGLPPGTVSAKDIGVVAAFRQQVLKLRLALRAAGLAGVNVGSVEDFQGQEMKIIVISTVLSEWVDRYETKGAIGLFGDPRRFNVAVTRGMALCVVVGKPQLLHADLHWRALLKYCVTNGGYSGADISSIFRRHTHTGTSFQPSDHFGIASEGNKEERNSNAITSGSDAHPLWQLDSIADDDDEALLNSVTEVANRMLLEAGEGGMAPGVAGVVTTGHTLRAYDMEWRNIL